MRGPSERGTQRGCRMAGAGANRRNTRRSGGRPGRASPSAHLVGAIPMKTVKTNLILAVAALALIVAPAASGKPLKRHMHGARVAKLQRALHLTADGAFGAGTSRAVRHFQRRHGL